MPTRRPSLAGILVLFMGLTSVFVPPATAYDVAEVQDGGTITGSVTLAGPVPQPKGFNLLTFPDPAYCGRISNGNGWRLLRDFIVGQGNGLKDVVVMLEGVEAGKAFALSIPRIEARDCQFGPFVTVVRDGHGVEMVNMDPVMHDLQAYETSQKLGARVLFNSPLPMNVHHERGNLRAVHRHIPGPSMLERIRLTKGRRIFFMQCGFHAFMESWAVAVTSPYYSISDADGSFTIDQIPPGTYRLLVWHPQTGPMQEQWVTVGPNGKTNVTVSIQAPTGHRSAFEVTENPRLGEGVLGRPLEIDPLVERQQ